MNVYRAFAVVLVFKDINLTNSLAFWTDNYFHFWLLLYENLIVANHLEQGFRREVFRDSPSVVDLNSLVVFQNHRVCLNAAIAIDQIARSCAFKIPFRFCGVYPAFHSRIVVGE